MSAEAIRDILTTDYIAEAKLYAVRVNAELPSISKMLSRKATLCLSIWSNPQFYPFW